jgi:aminoglycoside phosphotransferase family enzyme
MASQKIPDYIEALLDPAAYPHPVAEVQLIQTHISHVLIAGDHVYKFKKPVDFGFLDFSTLEKRAHYCSQEIKLNRRLCPDIYLGRIAVHRSEQGFSLGGDGAVIEYGVKMARMAEERMMSRVIDAWKLEKRHIDAIVDRLVPFYESAEVNDEIRSFGRPASVAVNVEENFDQTESFVGGPALSREQFAVVGDYARAVLGQEDRFLARIDNERIRDCHGDLYSANICLDEPVQIFDCIEFNDRFRYSDVAGDIGFLAMDLDYHGLDELAEYTVSCYMQKSGDTGLADLIDFYKCYRAYVRGKINLFTAADQGVDAETAAHCLEQAGRYFKLAERYAVDHG